MTTTQDASLTYGIESTFRTGVTPTRALEFVDESFDWTPNRFQGQGLRRGRRLPASSRRVTPTAQGKGDVTVEAVSKGLGLLWQLCMGTGSSTVVSGATYQQLFTLGDTLPAATIQKGSIQAGGTTDATTFLGCTVDSFEVTFGQDVLQVKPSFDVADVVTATAYTSPTYPAESVNLFHFANASISTGTLTAPTTTTLASSATPTGNVRSGSFQVSNNVRADRFNFGQGGRKKQQIRGGPTASGSLVVEYDSTTWRDAFLADTPASLVITYTAGTLSTGLETLQFVLPEIKVDSGGVVQTNGTDLVTQTINFSILDNLTAAQPLWIAARTSDAAL